MLGKTLSTVSSTTAAKKKVARRRDGGGDAADAHLLLAMTHRTIGPRLEVGAAFVFDARIP
jgi:hypothetical protein